MPTVTAQTAARASVAPDQRRHFAMTMVPSKILRGNPARRDSYYGVRALRRHRLFDLGNELLEGEWLGQEIELAIGGKVLLKGVLRIA